MNTRRNIPLAEFHQELKAQGVPSLHFAFKCPICGTIQSAQDLIVAGAGPDFEAVQQFLAFSCVGRFKRSGSHKPGEPPGRGCDWTLGGFLHLHELEITDEDGTVHHRFELASPEEAKAHMEKFAEVPA